jgi:hypothetical protein
MATFEDYLSKKQIILNKIEESKPKDSHQTVQSILINSLIVKLS